MWKEWANTEWWWWDTIMAYFHLINSINFILSLMYSFFSHELSLSPPDRLYHTNTGLLEVVCGRNDMYIFQCVCAYVYVVYRHTHCLNFYCKYMYIFMIREKRFLQTKKKLQRQNNCLLLFISNPRYNS